MTINGKRGTSSRLFPSLCLHRTMVVLGLRKARMAVRIRLEALYQRTRLWRMVGKNQVTVEL